MIHLEWIKKYWKQPGSGGAHLKSSDEEIEPGGSLLSLRLAWSAEQVPETPGYLEKQSTCLKKTKSKPTIIPWIKKTYEL